jgi:Xaa-Pro dipeptidase
MDFTDRSGMAPGLVGLDDSPAPRWLTGQAVDMVQRAESRSFTDAEFDDRLRRVRERMALQDMDAMLVFRPSSAEYLSGYHTAETTPQPLLVTATETLLYVPDLEVGRALASARVDHVLYCAYADALRGLARFLDHAVSVLPSRARVGVEVGHASTPPQAVEVLRAARVETVHGEHLVERVRLTLSEAEIGCVEEAALATESGVQAAVAAAGRPGATDSSVAAAVAAALFAPADSASAWGPVVATGERGGIPHSSWVGRPLGAGSTFLEFAGAHRRYHAPVMRTLSHGRPDAAVQRLSDLSRAALDAVLDSARPGVPCAQVAAAATEAVGPLPDDVVFHGVFGYPVGLAHAPHWMDGAPFYITVDNHEPLREGMVFHVPASFRSFGSAGVGLSQTFVVDTDGARVLTHGAAELIRV